MGVLPYVWRAVVPAGAVLLLTSCSSGSSPAVQAVVDDFGAAWRARDGAAVCGLLAPKTREEVESSTGKPCAEGILEEDLPEPGEPAMASVWGSAAQVRAAGDTFFLSRYDEGWRITAAGCTESEDGPYDCQVQGG